MPAKHLYRVKEEGTYLHIYNKGVEGRVIFNDSQDYEVFTGYLKDYLSTPFDLEVKKKEFIVKGRTFRGTPHLPKNYFNQIELIAYSLSSNHFHLLLQQTVKGASERFIRSLCTRYSMYFNKKYKRTGSLFEGSYKSVQINNPDQLLHLATYIHSHEGKGNDYSSHSEFLGQRETPWVITGHVLNSQEEAKNYPQFAEKYEIGTKEKEILQGITVETPEMKPIEKVQQVQKFSNQPPKIPASKQLHHSRLPEYFVLTGVFAVLFSVGLVNVTSSAANNNEMPLVLSATSAPTKHPLAAIRPIPTPLEQEILSQVASESALPPETATKSGVINVTETASQSAIVKTDKMVVVKIEDGSLSVKIRKSPTLYSEQTHEVKNGETFEFITKNYGWYEILLPDGTTGFISPKYAYLK